MYLSIKGEHSHSLIMKFQDGSTGFVTSDRERGITYFAAAVLDSLHGAACAVHSGRHVGVGWRTRHGFVACTSVAHHLEEPSPAR